MNLALFLWILFVVFDKGDLGKTFHCFYCHQTSKECNNGMKMNLNVLNCNTNTCFVLKYETEMPGVTVLATFRGCYVEPVNEMMRTVVTEKHAVVKKHFHLCNHTLCNSGTRLKCSICILLLLLQTFLLL